VGVASYQIYVTPQTVRYSITHMLMGSLIAESVSILPKYWVPWNQQAGKEKWFKYSGIEHGSI